ncbi:sortase-dependent protein [Streptomyces sp. NPDC048664]|uniref:sortase-dependent protein n=1 Tax=Streptomyces sp. NPDC048664 TaxID=3154505 RepID=UPI0034185A0B
MRRTILSALALSCTAVLAGTVPAFAHGVSPSPVPSRAASSATPSAVPSAGPSRDQASARPAPVGPETGGQVSVVPKGAPDTGVAVPSASGGEGGLIGAGAAAALVAAGAGAYVVRRRRTTTGA